MKFAFALLTLFDAQSVRNRRDLISWNRHRNSIRSHKIYRRYDQTVADRVETQMYLSEIKYHISQSKNLTSFHSTYVYSLLF